MALTGLVNLTEQFLNQIAAQTQNTTAASNNTVSSTQSENGEPVDQFTPSTQNVQTAAQAAGLFTVSQFALFSAAAGLLLTQADTPATSQTNNTGENNTTNPFTTTTALAALPNNPVGTAFALLPAAVNSTEDTNTNTNAAQGRAVANNSEQANAAVQASAAANISTAAPTTNTGTSPAGSPAVQNQLQSLNSALAALGLNATEIQEIDQIASLIQDFNPSVFTSLAYQLEDLSQQATSQQPAQSTNATSSSTATANGTGQGATKTGGAANPATANAVPYLPPPVGEANGASPNGRFQLQGLVIRFAGVQAQDTSGATTNTGATSANPAIGQGNGNAFQQNAFNLQLKEVNLTLTNKNGQTLQVQAPQPPAFPQVETTTATKTNAAAA
jgi:hypothetical protein